MPEWLTAPARLIHFPGVLAAVFGSAVILAITVAAAPLMLSSAGSAALRDQIAATSGSYAGVRFQATTSISADRVAFRKQLVRDATRGMQLEHPVMTLEGSINGLLTKGGKGWPIQLLTRDGFADHIHVVEGEGDDGFFVPVSAARVIGAEPGDRLTVTVNGVSAPVTVAGIYADVTPTNVTPYWFPVLSRIAPANPKAPNPPPFLIATTPRFTALEEDLVDQGTIELDLDLQPGLPLETAKHVAEEIGAIQASRFDPASSMSGAFATIDSGLPQLVKTAEETVSATDQPLRAVSIAGTLVALVVAGAAGAYGVRRRRTEIGLLSARGVGPGGVGVRAGAESVLPVAVGTVVGWIVAIVLVRAIGPSELIASGARLDSLVQAVIAAIIAVVLLGAAAGLASRGEQAEPQGGRLRAVAGRLPWELAALGAAGAALYEILSRGTAPVEVNGPQATPHLDLLVLLFPFLFVAGTCGLATRWLRSTLPRLKQWASERSPSTFLAASRLAAAPKQAASLVAAAALALGVLTYAGVLASSISATAKEKSTLSIGADVALVTVAQPVVTGDPPFAWTPVTRIPDMEITPQEVPADVLAVDPHTFARAAYWNSRLGGSLTEMIRRLETASGTSVRALVAGGSLGSGSSLSVLGKAVPIDPVASLGDFPGARRGRITLILDQTQLQEVGHVDINGVGHFFELWAKGNPARILPYLNKIGLPTDTASTSQKVRATPAFLALSWTFGVLEAFGVLAGLIAALGMILYLQARQQSREVSYALARRMGLGPGSHLRSVVAEIGTMLVAAFLLGGVFAFGAAALVHRKLDPIPSLPPSPFLMTPISLFAATAVGVVLVSTVGAWWVQRRADRANPAEVMRLAG